VQEHAPGVRHTTAQLWHTRSLEGSGHASALRRPQPWTAALRIQLCRSNPPVLAHARSMTKASSASDAGARSWRLSGGRMRPMMSGGRFWPQHQGAARPSQSRDRRPCPGILFLLCSRRYHPAMGHTVTTRKRAAEALRSPLEGWSGWRLAVECGGPGCATGRAYGVAQLCRSYPGRTVYEAVSRMRCNGCGRPPAEVRLVPAPGMPRRAEAIPLRGPGSVGYHVAKKMTLRKLPPAARGQPLDPASAGRWTPLV